MGGAMLMFLCSTIGAASPGALIAPGPRELREAEAELEQRVLQAEAVGRAASRLQNAAFRADDPCDDGLLVRALAFAEVWRDAAQRARVQGDRAQRIAASKTLTPIMNEERTASIAELATRAQQQARAWFEFDRLEARRRTTCEEPLAEAPGLRSPTPVPSDQEGRPVAVWVLRGVLCPGGRSSTGVAVVSESVCVDVDSACSCDVAEVLPGAVLAP